MYRADQKRKENKEGSDLLNILISSEFDSSIKVSYTLNFARLHYIQKPRIISVNSCLGCKKMSIEGFGTAVKHEERSHICQMYHCIIFSTDIFVENIFP